CRDRGLASVYHLLKDRVRVWMFLLCRPRASRYERFENISVGHHDHSYDRGQRDRMPQDKSEDQTFVANLICRRCGYDYRLRVDHLAHHPARAVCRAHKNRAQSELLSSYALKPSKQRIGRCVAPRQCDSQPSEECPKERKQPPGPGECQSEYRVHPRIASNKAQPKHARDSEHRESHPDKRSPEDSHKIEKGYSQQQSRDNCRKKTTGAGRRQPVEIVLCLLRLGV